jgi:flagellar biosynthesis/type III secretory pathway M-ring protein FliF/YscJ
MKLNDTQLVFCPPPHSAQQEAENPRETEQAADGATDKPSRRATRRKKTRDGASQQPTKRAHAQSKQDRVIEMLKRRPGATIAAIIKATGGDREAWDGSE